MNMKRIIFAGLMLAALSACATTSGVVEREYVQVEVPVAAQCPDDATYAAVMAARPVPLRGQERPADVAAAERQQLGRYEAPGQWADQAAAVITSCHSRAPLDPR